MYLKMSQVTYLTIVPPSGEQDTASSGGHYRERYTHATMLRGVQAKTKVSIKYQLYQAKGVAPGTV